MEDLGSLNNLIETGGSIACICVLVYLLVKYFIDYLKNRDIQENEFRKEMLKEAREERDEYNKISHEEHLQQNNIIVDLVDKLKGNK